MKTTDPAHLPKGEPAGAFDAIHLAARNRDFDALHSLIKSGVDVNKRNQKEPNGDGGNTPLWFAAQGTRPASIPVTEALLEAGADIDSRCEYGTTALHLAASWGHFELVKYLVDNGADPTLKDDSGKTALDAAKADFECMRQESSTDNLKVWLKRMPMIIQYLEERKILNHSVQPTR